MGRRQPVAVKPRAAGRRPAVKARAVEGGFADLLDDFLPRGRCFHPDGIFDQVVAAFLLFRPLAVAGHVEGYRGGPILGGGSGFPLAGEGENGSHQDPETHNA